MNKCTVCDSTFGLRGINKFGSYYCNRHYKQMVRHGKTLDRTIYDANEIVIDNDVAYVLIYDKDGKETCRATIDLEDVERVKGLKWSLLSGYAWCTSKETYLHRFILDYDGDMDIDHINRNRLDNRKDNLRIASHSDNSKNIKLPTDNKTGVIGVCWDKTRSKWRAEIKVDGHKYNIGRFSSLTDAIVARLKYEKELFKDFAPQKHLFKEYEI